MKIGIVGPVDSLSIARVFPHFDLSEAPLGYSSAPFLADMIGGLVRKGHHVTVFTTDSSYDFQGKPFVKFEFPQLDIYFCAARSNGYKIRNKKIGKSFDFFSFERKNIKSAIENSDVEILHAHWSYEFAMAALATGLPNVVTFHDMPPTVLKMMPNLYRFIRYLMAIYVAKNAKNVTTVSPYMQEGLRNWRGIDSEVVANPIGHHWFDVECKPLDENSIKYYSCINGWSKLKNPENLLKAFKLIRNKQVQSTLHLFGVDFEVNGKAHCWALKNDLADGVFFYGFKTGKDLISQVSQMDFLIHTSKEESFGMTVAEALAMGKPCVVGATSGALPWLIDKASIGTCVDISSVESIADGVLNTNISDGLTQSSVAKENMRTSFSVEAILNQYEAIYLKVIRKECFE